MTISASTRRSRTGVLLATALLGALLLIRWHTGMATDIQSEPVPVRIGLKISQITDINQEAENFTVVGTLRMQWSMTSLAFDPGRGESDYRTYDVDRFLAMLSERNIRWPKISFYNQQGRSAV